MGDHGLALLLKQLDQSLLLGDQGVDLGGFVVEEGARADSPKVEFPINRRHQGLATLR